MTNTILNYYFTLQAKVECILFAELFQLFLNLDRWNTQSEYTAYFLWRVINQYNFSSETSIFQDLLKPNCDHVLFLKGSCKLHPWAAPNNYQICRSLLIHLETNLGGKKPQTENT